MVSDMRYCTVCTSVVWRCKTKSNDQIASDRAAWGNRGKKIENKFTKIFNPTIVVVSLGFVKERTKKLLTILKTDF